ncbi:polysaccharide pyruvyl transferase family protein, partial [Enterococcus faecium]|uniref:polysaccharide pyruvyl transferase family protein n=1 Tax=Enterococcus faecium TaxID=1352 RepID=UPI0023B21C90
ETHLSNREEKEKYILTYFLCEPSEDIWNKISFLANTKKLKIIQVMGDSYQYDKYIFDPFEFVNKIKNAEYVFTDSFHGTVFSIIMNTKFFVTRRPDKREMFSRIENLINTFGLEEVVLENCQDPLSIEYAFGKVNDILLTERVRGKKIIEEEILNNILETKK